MNVPQQIETLLRLQKEIEMSKVGADVSWVNSSGYIIFFMQTGFCLLESGTARHKHHNHTILLQLLNAMGSVFGWWILGYAFGYGDDVSHFIGNTYFAGKSLLESPQGMADWIFDMGSAATASKIVSGAILERVFAYSYLLFAVFMTAWIYPVARKYKI